MRNALWVAVAVIMGGVLILSGCELQKSGEVERTVRGPEVWMAPPTWVDDNHELFADQGQSWKGVRDGVDVFKFYRHFLADESDEVLEKAVRTMKKGGIKIAVEISPVKTGPDEVREIDERLRKYGAKLDYVDLDNTLGILMDAGWIGKTHRVRWMERPATVDEAVEELVGWVKQVREFVPEAKIGMIECVWRYDFDEYPGTDPAKTFKDNRPSHGDLRPIMDMVFKRFEEEALELAFFHGEHARLQVMQIAEGPDVDKWGKLKRLEKYFKDKGVAFGILYADESTAWWWPDRVKENQDETFVNNVVKSVREHWDNGGRVDHVVIQSWGRQPSKLADENEENTFANMMKRVLDEVEKR